MASPQAERQQAGEIELTDLERRVVAALVDSGEPLDTVAVASLAKLRVVQTLEILQSLRERHIIEPRDPEPIRQRFEVDDEVLQRAAS